MLTISLLTLGDPGRLSGGFLYHRRMAAAAAAHDARIVFTSFPVLPFPLPAVSAGRVLRRAQATSPDVVVLDSIAAAFFAPWLATHRLDLPLAAIVHQPAGGIDHRRPRTSVQALLDLAAYRRTRRLLVASDALAQSFRAAGFADEQVRVIAPGRDVAAGQDIGAARGAAPATEVPIEDLREGRHAAVISVGSWVARKGLLSLLDAFARLPAESATLHLVGDKAAEPVYAVRVRARLSRPDLDGRVRIHGPVSKERVATLYRSADIFALPSVREPYGTVYAEAMASGLPVVGWRAGNLPNLARDGREGIVLAPGDIHGLAGALHRLVGDERYRAELGAAARRRAESFPTWAQTAELFFAELVEVAAR